MITSIEQLYALYQLSNNLSDISNLLGLDTLIKTLEEEDTSPNQEEENKESNSDKQELELVKFIATKAT